MTRLFLKQKTGNFMMKNRLSYLVRYCTLSLLAFTFQASAEHAEGSSVRLSGHVPSKVLSHATHLERVHPATEIPVAFVLPLRNEKELEELVQRMYDPADEEHYGKYLTPEEFVEQFAPTQEDYEKVIAYVQSLGLTVTGTHANRTLLNVSGPSASLEAAFNLQLHHYQKANGRVFHAPDNDPEVLAPIASMVRGVVGLDNHARRHTYNRQKGRVEGVVKSEVSSLAHPSGPGGGYSPSDILTAYNLNGLSADGSDQIIALFELGGYLASDINEYTNHFGLPPAKLTNILVDGGSTDGIDPEVTLDIELAVALAPGSQIYVYEGPNSDQGVLDTYNRIATDNLAKQVSTSWGMGENVSSPHYLQAENAIFLQMAAHGQTIYAAAGDSGAYDNYPNNSALAVDDPASQPYVIGVGGTRLTVDAGTGAYSGESVWNDGTGNRAGGGVSGFWPIPSWQKNVAGIASTTHRNVPDVALNADTNTGYAIYYNGQWTIYGGTSCAAPLWAAFTARVNQERQALQKPSLGFANPLLYSLAAGSSYVKDFHDVMSGNNLYYRSHKGYDNASGWGSFNGAPLLASLTQGVQTVSQSSPSLHATATLSGSFIKGKNANYTIVVVNQGDAPTSGPVSVAITLPTGLSYKSWRGSGWTFNAGTLTCSRSDVLQAGASYPPITLQVYVSRVAPNGVSPIVTVSGS